MVVATDATSPVDLLAALLPEELGAQVDGSREAIEACCAELLGAAAAGGTTEPAVAREYLSYVAQRIPASQDLLKSLESLRAEDLALAWACARGDEAAIAEIERRHFDVIDAVIAQTGDLGISADEVKQQLRDRLFVVGADGKPPRIAQYAGRGDLRGWLRVAAVRDALMWRRKVKREVPLGDERLSHLARPEDDPELAHLKQLYRSEFEAAFIKALNSLEAEQRNLLRYHYFERLSIDELGTILGTHRATAARRLQRVREKLLEGTRDELRRALAVDHQQLNSIMRLIQSRLHVSIQRHLDPKDR